MIRGFLKKIAGNTRFYKFCAWLYGKYCADCEQQYEPHQFRFLGVGASIGNGVQINKPERVIIKEYSNIGKGAIINSKGGLYVGRYTGIGFNCVIWTSEHHYRGAKSIPFDNGSDLKPVVIRDFVWIGSNVMITPGRHIGEGAIIGIGTVIDRDVPPLAIVMGNPGKVVGYRDKEHFDECKAAGAFQTIHVERYVEKMFPMYKRRFEAEIEELGLSDL